MLHKIQIEYCAVWHYTERAVSLTADLLEIFEPELAEVILVPSDGGRLEVSVDGKLIYSKLQTGRHPEPGEVIGLIKKII